MRPKRFALAQMRSWQGILKQFPRSSRPKGRARPVLVTRTTDYFIDTNTCFILKTIVRQTPERHTVYLFVIIGIIQTEAGTER